MKTTTIVLLAALIVGIACAPGAAACHRTTDLCMFYEDNVAALTPTDDEAVYFVVETADHLVDDLPNP